MQPLETTKKVLTWLYLCPPDENLSLFKKISCMAFCFGTITIMAMASLSGLIFAIKTISNDLEQCFYALFHTIATSTLLYMLIAIFLSRHQISNIFNSISKIYKLASKNDWVFSFRYYFWRKKNNKWWGNGTKLKL